MKRKVRPKHEFDLLDNSIERVINATLRILDKLIDKKLPKEFAEDVYVNQDDWRNLKETTVRIWNEARNEIVKREME